MIRDDLIDVEFSFDGWVPSAEDATFGEDYPDSLLYDRSEWRDRLAELAEHDPFDGPHPKGCIVANYGPYVFNQNPESSCVHNAACGAVMRRWNMQLGNSRAVILSPMSGYCRVTRRRHSGSMMWGALELSSREGHLPSCEHGQTEDWEHCFHENTPFVQREKLPSGWEATARHFRCLEWLRLDGREQFASALLNQYPICYGRSGHSMVAEDLVYDKDRRAFYSRTCDSYGFSARDGTGRIYDSERKWSTGGAWACRTVTMPDEV